MNPKSSSRTSIVGLLMILLGILMFVAFFAVSTRREGESNQISQSTNTLTLVADSDARPDTSARSPAAETPTAISIQQARVNARQPWQIALPSVKQGDWIKIEHIGGTWAVWGGPGGVRNRADGTGYADERPTGDPLSSAPAGALIGRIGNGEPFYVGNQKEFRAPQSGALALQINDVAPNDNARWAALREAGFLA